MMRCNKTGLTDNNWKTILDVLNVYDPNDIAHAIPEMATPEFMQDVQSAFKVVLAHVNTSKYNSDMMDRNKEPIREADKPKPVDGMSLGYQQYIYNSDS